MEFKSEAAAIAAKLAEDPNMKTSEVGTQKVIIAYCNKKNVWKYYNKVNVWKYCNKVNV